jgi:hypothetical protein
VLRSYPPYEHICLLLGRYFQTTCEHLKRLRVWGSRCYVLDLRLQDEKKILKWEPRCRKGQCLGVSLDNLTTVLSNRQLKIVTLLGQGTTFAVSLGCLWSKGQYLAACSALANAFLANCRKDKMKDCPKLRGYSGKYTKKRFFGVQFEFSLLFDLLGSCLITS